MKAHESFGMLLLVWRWRDHMSKDVGSLQEWQPTRKQGLQSICHRNWILPTTNELRVLFSATLYENLALISVCDTLSPELRYIVPDFWVTELWTNKLMIFYVIKFVIFVILQWKTKPYVISVAALIKPAVTLWEEVLLYTVRQD